MRSPGTSVAECGSLHYILTKFHEHSVGALRVYEAHELVVGSPLRLFVQQGEAIGFTPDGKGYYTTSEGVFSPIYYYTTPSK